MAQDGEKTEKPTAKRLRDARKKGQVSKSTELNSAFILLAVMAALWLGGAWAMEGMRAAAADAMRVAFARDFWPAFTPWMEGAVLVLFVSWGAMFLIVGLIAALICRLQVGSVFSMDPIMPKLERVNPVAGLKRIFSKKTLLNFVMTLLKTLFVSAVIYSVAKASLPDMLRMSQLSPEYIAITGSVIVMRLLASAWFVYIAMAGFDLLIQRHWYIEDMKMAKHEVKRDHKETEGNPEIKGKRRQLAHDLIFEELEEAVGQASVVVTNPTHIAVALAYHRGETPLPKVVAKGGDDMAAMIRRIAERRGIPVVRDVALARRIFETTPIDQYISRDLFEPVAKVLLWAKRIQEEHARERGL